MVVSIPPSPHILSLQYSTVSYRGYAIEYISRTYLLIE